MAHYLGLATIAGSCCQVPGRESICLSLALAGFLCLAAGLALVLRAGREAADLRIEE